MLCVFSLVWSFVQVTEGPYVPGTAPGVMHTAVSWTVLALTELIFWLGRNDK